LRAREAKATTKRRSRRKTSSTPWMLCPCMGGFRRG
jgi:hypothetical protein